MENSDSAAQPESPRSVRGPVVPPFKSLQERWNDLDADVSSGKNDLDKAKKGFIDAVESAAPSYGGLASLKIKCEESNDVEFDPTEHYSRVFRAACKLSSAYEIDGDQGEFAPTGAKVVGVQARWGHVWGADVPDRQDVSEAVSAMSDLVAQPDPEMLAQVDHPDIFMIWAAVPSGSKAKDFVNTGLLVDTLMLGLAFVSYEVKARAQVQRPWVVDGSIKPTLPKPDHSSWPAGHAFVGGALATLLSSLQKTPDANRLWAAAARIGHNRIRGGLHTSLDVQVGLELGAQVIRDLLVQAKRASKQPDGSKQGTRLAHLWQLACAARCEWK